MTASKKVYVPRRAAPSSSTGAIAQKEWVTGECVGCGRHRRLYPDGTVYDHKPLIPEFGLPDAEHPLVCVGSGLPAAGQTPEPPAPPVIVKIPAPKIAGVGVCRICSRPKKLRGDGRLGAHHDPLGLACDGAGRLPKPESVTA